MVIDRRAFLGSLAGLAAPPGSLASAQSTSKVHRIGILGSTPEPTQTALLETFLGRLRELGYAEGRNLVVERRFSEGRNERYRALAKELVDLKMDVIVAPGTAAALAAKEATSTVPIVTVVAGDPVGSRLIASFARPGGNVTGMSSSGGVTTKHLELMKEIMPRLSRVAVLSNPTTTLHTALFKELEGAGRTLRVHLRPVAVSSPKDLESAFAAILRERPEALIPLDDPLIFLERRRIADFALRHRLPAASFQRFFPEAGMLMSYGPSYADLFQRAAPYVDRILKGAKPADLPVEQPIKFEFVINLKTAKALGLRVPPSLLQQADAVLE